MKIKLYLDDIRDPKGSDFVVVRTAEEAIDLVRSGNVEYISFDHDLGTDLTGYDVALVVEELVYRGEIQMPEWNVHSANPVGSRKIEQCMKNAEKYVRNSQVHL